MQYIVAHIVGFTSLFSFAIQASYNRCWFGNSTPDVDNFPTSISANNSCHVRTLSPAPSNFSSDTVGDVTLNECHTINSTTGFMADCIQQLALDIQAADYAGVLVEQCAGPSLRNTLHETTLNLNGTPGACAFSFSIMDTLQANQSVFLDKGLLYTQLKAAYTLVNGSACLSRSFSTHLDETALREFTIFNWTIQQI
ncbi:hypothetical protein F5Y15DRAFT_399755 [Xylariaceae sp. FL0016]|nr:hypothetical protein F5Y15DRAFT_399755 [Xylariaceae sp. FL0016]